MGIDSILSPEQRAWQVASSVLDPEVPVLNVAELGILRSVSIDKNGVVIAQVTPTYNGCPAVVVIELAIETALLQAGFEAKVERVLTPAWTTDWISEVGRKKLLEYGIAPPLKASGSVRSLFKEEGIACPQCQSLNTQKTSEFGTTACKALYKCLNCQEPFEYFKCL